jgi:GT2 family glycosyltransferase
MVPHGDVPASKLEMSVVLVNHNGGAHLHAAVRALQENTRCESAEIVVVDSNSTDRSAEDLPRGRLPVRVISCQENVGFCRGSNVGVAAARGRLIAFAQPDGEVLTGWDQGVRRAIDEPGVAVVGGIVLKMGAEERIDSAGMAIAPNFAGWSMCENLTPEQAGLRVGEWREVVGVSPAFLMVRRADHLRIGGFWEDLWMYGDEPDYAVRVRALGRALVCPESRMRHWVGTAAGEHQSPLRLYWSARNRLLNAARHLPPRHLVVAVLLTLAFDTLQIIQQRRRAAAAAVLRGWLAGARGMPAARRLSTPAARAAAASCLATLPEAIAQQRALGRASLARQR